MIGRNNGAPLLVDQVEQSLRERVTQMIAISEVAMPQERELARSYGVSLRTVRSATRRLKDEKLLRSVSGKGTFIVPQEKRVAPLVVVCGGMEHPYGALCAQTVMLALRARRQASTLCVCEEIDHDWPLFQAAVQNSAGVLVVGRQARHNLTGLLSRTTKPVVLVGDLNDQFCREPLGCPQITIDSRAASFLATRHLLSLGHRRIMLAGCLNAAGWVRELLRGYREALEQAGVAYDERLFVLLPTVSRWDGNNPVEYAETRSPALADPAQMLSAADGPTALIFYTTSEHQMRELMARHFRKRYPEHTVVTVTYAEHLERDFRGQGELDAVGVSLRGLMERAIDLVGEGRQDIARPALEVMDFSRLYRRQNGQWQSVVTAPRV